MQNARGNAEAHATPSKATPRVTPSKRTRATDAGSHGNADTLAPESTPGKRRKSLLSPSDRFTQVSLAVVPSV